VGFPAIFVLGRLFKIHCR